jgi:Serine carboxypeptidase S28
MQASVEATRGAFGGLNPHVYRVFFTHGEMDPRRSLGPADDINDNSPVVVMSRKWTFLAAFRDKI